MKKNYFCVLLWLLVNTFIQFPVASESKPDQKTKLEIISDAFTEEGFVSINDYERPCFGTAERADSLSYRGNNVPIVVICPMTEEEGKNRYLTDTNESLSAIKIKTFFTKKFSNVQENYAVERAELAANIFARVYHNITSSKIEGVLKDELNKTFNRVNIKEGMTNYGIICRFRKRKLINEVVFETMVCPEVETIGIHFEL